MMAAAALMGLLVVTVAVSFLSLGPFGVVVAITIALAKAVIIALFFMHLRYASHITVIFAAAGIYWLLIMFALTFGDYLTRP